MKNLTMATILLSLLLTGCGTLGYGSSPTGTRTGGPPELTPVSETYQDLLNLPPPAGRIPVAVYGFRDRTGQYRPAPNSSFSSAVTQGAGSILIKALLDSRWFIPMEREGLQDLLTERRIIRAAAQDQDAPGGIPSLRSASILLEGGIIGYETNVRTGGAGARYFGIGASEKYRVDQVTVNLRAVDVRSGQVLNSVFTTKTVYSRQLEADVFRFVRFRRLLEAEVGYSQNEPTQLAVRDAVESAVVHLIVQGIAHGTWNLENPRDVDDPVLQDYLEQVQSIGYNR